MIIVLGVALRFEKVRCLRCGSFSPGNIFRQRNTEKVSEPIVTVECLQFCWHLATSNSTWWSCFSIDKGISITGQISASLSLSTNPLATFSALRSWQCVFSKRKTACTEISEIRLCLLKNYFLNKSKRWKIVRKVKGDYFLFKIINLVFELAQALRWSQWKRFRPAEVYRLASGVHSVLLAEVSVCFCFHQKGI